MASSSNETLKHAHVGIAANGKRHAIAFRRTSVFHKIDEGLLPTVVRIAISHKNDQWAIGARRSLLLILDDCFRKLERSAKRRHAHSGNASELDLSSSGGRVNHARTGSVTVIPPAKADD